MKTATHITTAANSKTMNAVEQPKFFAAAENAEPLIDLNEREREKTTIVKKVSRRNVKQKMIS